MIIFVLLIHSTGLFSTKLYNFYPKPLFSIRQFSICIAVPVFFILMGRNYGTSFKRHQYTTLKSIYSINYFKKQLKRTVYPMVIIAIFSIPIGLFVKGHLYFGVETLIGRIPFEGFDQGWGNYFFSIILQFIFVFPLLYILHRKYPNLMLVMAFIINLFFELIVVYFPIFYNDAYIYKACILRYLFTIALGLWVSDKLTTMSIKELFSTYKFILVGLGLSIIVIAEYAILGVLFPFLASWQPQNLLSAFYPFVIMILLYHILPSETNNKIVKFGGSLGKASYHIIFLMQILYFSLGYTGVKLILTTKLYLQIGAYSFILSTIIDLIVCISLGYLFYYATTKIKNPFKNQSEDTETQNIPHFK